MQQLKLQTQNFWFTLKHKCHWLSCQLSAAAETLTVAILDCLLLHSLSPSDPASGRTAPPHHEPPLKAQKTQHVVNWAQRLRVHEQAKDNKTAFIIQLLLFTIYYHRKPKFSFLVKSLVKWVFEKKTMFISKRLWVDRCSHICFTSILREKICILFPSCTFLWNYFYMTMLCALTTTAETSQTSFR